ncbi:hypothetical protein SteCoe_34707 [Stentor coeruleus]|uniref:Uncharacterized protein n=1 Tax=Stentor coeruleus TaxID=5963 RepID=A0A1R2AU62_9CILI|nr:hypothetical protein SteCoe_34707 [Stentor coeruleus]
MNIWENQILNCISSKDSQGAIKLIKQGFPINYSIKLRDSFNNPQPGFSNLLIESISHNLKHLCTFLINSGISVNTKDSLGRHPVHLAASKGKINILLLLINHNSNISARDAYGNTILHISAMNHHYKFVEFVVEKLKFPVIVMNKFMKKPLDLCKDMQEKSRSLKETEELEFIIQYLWRKEEEYKVGNEICEGNGLSSLSYGKKSIMKLKKIENAREYAQVPIFPLKKQLTSMTPLKGRRNIENYLKGKHEAIQKDIEDKLSSSLAKVSKTRSPSPILKFPKLKKKTP